MKDEEQAMTKYMSYVKEKRCTNKDELQQSSPPSPAWNSKKKNIEGWGLNQGCVQLTETFVATQKTEANFPFICDSFPRRVANIPKLFLRCLLVQ